MNIESMREAVETILEREIDGTVWDRFARGVRWECDVVELLARLFEDAEPDIIQTLAETDAEAVEIEG